MYLRYPFFRAGAPERHRGRSTITLSMSFRMYEVTDPVSFGSRFGSLANNEIVSSRHRFSFSSKLLRQNQLS